MKGSDNQSVKNSEEELQSASIFNWLIPLLISMSQYVVVVTLWGKEWPFIIKMLYAMSSYVLLLKVYQYLFVKISPPKTKPEPHPAHQWPVPGPYKNWGYIGKVLPYITFYGSSLLTLLNPFLIIQQLRMMMGQIKAYKRLKASGKMPHKYQTQVAYRLPFDGEWLVYNGGHTPATSHSWEVLNQRYAFDFVKADKDYNRHEKKGTRLDDYFCYRQPILAAANGEVISVVNHIGDGPLVGYYVMDFLTTQIAGSHVIIKHADGEYGFYAHLIKGSISVSEGETVSQGQMIGLCGHSGNSSEPHLHFHLQDTADFFAAMGLPIAFTSVSVDGKMTSDSVVLKRGDIVENQANQKRNGVN